MKRIIGKSVILFLRLYKAFVSNYIFLILGGGCRYKKTCSEFAIDAINERGLVEGSKISLKRFLSCQPFSKRSYATLDDS